MDYSRYPTKIKAHIPKLDGSGYVPETWGRGQRRINPAGKSDIVNGITLWPDQLGKVRAVIEWEGFGEEWVLDYIVFIEFENDKQPKARGEGS